VETCITNHDAVSLRWLLSCLCAALIGACRVSDTAGLSICNICVLDHTASTQCRSKDRWVGRGAGWGLGLLCGQWPVRARHSDCYLQLNHLQREEVNSPINMQLISSYFCGFQKTIKIPKKINPYQNEMCVYVRVNIILCLYEYMFIQSCAYTHIHIHIVSIYYDTYAYMSTYICMYVYVFIYMYLCITWYIHIHTHKNMFGSESM